MSVRTHYLTVYGKYGIFFKFLPALPFIFSTEFQEKTHEPRAGVKFFTKSIHYVSRKSGKAIYVRVCECHKIISKNVIFLCYFSLTICGLKTEMAEN